MEGISVIICCYNSALKLAETIRHLSLQKFPSAWEIIIIDNNSTDGTSSVALEEWAKYKVANVEFNIAKESKPGLGYARKKGINISKYDYIIFCDDDNWFDVNYLSAVYDIFKTYSSVGYIGGEAQATFEPGTMVPDWFINNAYGYAVGKQYQTNGIQSAVSLWGAGMAVRKIAIQKVFDPKFPLLLSGRSGTALTSGEDSEICYRLNMMGYKPYYTDHLRLKHFISSPKLTLEYKTNLHEGFKSARLTISSYEEAIIFLKKGHLQKILFTLKEAIRFIFPYYPNRRISASRYLYFATGIKIFGNETDHYIASYLKHINYKISG